MALVYNDLKQKLLCCVFRIRIWKIIIMSYTHLFKGNGIAIKMQLLIFSLSFVIIF